jgi:hypothetical protein
MNLLKAIASKLFNSTTTFMYLAFAIMIIGKIIFWYGHPLLTYPDQAAYLEMAELIASGKLPYLDFFEWNPPLIMYLNLIPLAFAKQLHVPVIAAFNYSVIALCAYSTLMSLHIASKYMSKQQLTVFLPFIFAAAYFNLNQTINIGEREHLFTVAYLPFLILRGLAWQGQKLSKFDAILSAFVAAVGMALKPQFAVSAALVELCFYYQCRTLKVFARPEIYTVAVVFMLYLAGLMLLPLSVWDFYFNQVVPLYINGLSYSGRALIYMLRHDPNFFLPFVHLLVTLPLALVFARFNLWIAPLGIFALSFLFHYIYGDQAWPYRFIPMTASLFMLDGLLIGMLVEKIFSRPNLSKFANIVMSFAILGIASYTTYSELISESANRAISTEPFDLANIGYQGDCLASDFDPLVFSILSLTKLDDSVIFIGNGIEPGFPAILQSGRKLGSRYLFCNLPFIDHCATKTHDQRWTKMAESAVENYGQDILKNKPAVIYVQQRQLDELLERYHFFNRFMGAYELAGENNFYKIWTLTGRQPKSGVTSDPKQIVIDIMAKKTTIDDAVLESGYERSKIERWLYLSRLALEHAVSKHTSDRQIEIDENINKLNDTVNQLKAENEQLKLDLQKK